MYLKNIEIQGFKSFADKICLDLTPQITAVVGPNGSGKSNISDAIRWAMGEQSAKALRGAKMDDVIFSGTEERKALGFAEVSITIDNTEKILPLDFSEVTVTRRVYRSGEGEYFINKSSCRLKDIHELFMDTGLGREGYSIIGQGKIDEILSTKSEDRRQIFEEAAGITKYKYRKNEAERKLSQVSDNLLRVKDIMTELEAQITPLEIQSEKAKKFLNLREELKILDLNVSIVSIDNLKKSSLSIEEDYAVTGGQLEKVKFSLDEKDREAEEMQKTIRGCDEKMEECRTGERDAQNKINSYNNDINLFLAAIQHNAENITRISNEIKQNQEDIRTLNNDLNFNAKTLEELNAKNAAVSQSIEEITKQESDALGSVNSKTSEIESLKTKIIEKSGQISNAKNKISNSNVLIDNFSARKSSIEKELSERSGDYEKLKNNIQALEEKLSAKTALSDKLKFDLETLEEQNAKDKEDYTDLISMRNAQTLELDKKSSRKNLLEDMEKNYEGYGRSVKSVMTAFKGNTNLHGPLSQLISTHQDYAIAIEAALGAAAQNIVVNEESDAKLAINYLKKHNLGRATFLPISSIRGSVMDANELKSQDGFIDIASNLVMSDKSYSVIVQSFLGKTAVVHTVDHGIAMAKRFGHRFRIVTLDGTILQAGGAMTGGSVGKGSGFLSRTHEIEALSGEITRINDAVLSLKDKGQRLSEKINSKNTKIEEMAAELSVENRDILKISTDLTHLREFLSSSSEGKIQLETEFGKLESQIESVNADVTQMNDEILVCSDEIESLNQAIAKQQDIYASVASNREAMLNKIMELNIERNAVLKDIELQNERIQKINEEKSEILSDIETKQQEIRAFEDKIEEMKDDIDFKKEQISQFDIGVNNTQEAMKKLIALKQESTEKMQQSTQNAKEARETLYVLQQEYAKIESRKIKTELELETIINKMWEDYELTYSHALEYKKEGLPIAKSQKRINEMRDEIRDLGNINIDAIEEFKNVKQRYEFLLEQTGDLDKSKLELEGLISEMTVIMQEQFAEQFTYINENFNIVFRKLFGGGGASLSLSDPSNLLESGIEIEARPPGKKLQNLSLLSGGERAFTAIALLFAILEVRPTPFCILDEIEAALDDVNVYRFANYLRKYSEKTQFIMVTHRRGTMEAANMLYGVTMQEKGVSKLLSLSIDEVEEAV